MARSVGRLGAARQHLALRRDDGGGIHRLGGGALDEQEPPLALVRLVLRSDARLGVLIVPVSLRQRLARALDALRALPNDAELFASDARLREAGYRPADEVWPGRDGEPSGLREEL